MWGKDAARGRYAWLEQLDSQEKREGEPQQGAQQQRAPLEGVPPC
jgi:hypothetical protein